jgi:uncharacterized membrane protein
MKKNVLFILFLYLVAIVVTILFWNKFPNQIPIHWNIQGQVDNYGPKWALLFFLHLPIVILAIMTIIPKIDPQKNNYYKHARAYYILKVAVPYFFYLIYAVIVMYSIGIKIDVFNITLVCVGVLWIVIGNQLPRFRHNYFVGIRTPWTLANQDVWRKTHRIGGYCLTVSGAIIIVFSFMPSILAKTVGVCILLVGALTPVVFSYFYFRKQLS